MSFSRKKLFKSINKQFNHRSANYIVEALEQIDIAVANEEISHSFVSEYYKLKRKIEVVGTNLPNIFIGILTSTIISFAVQANIIVFAILITLCIIFALWILLNYATKQGVILEPYLLKRMEEKINEDHTKAEFNNHRQENNTMKKKFLDPIWDWMNIFLLAITIITTIVFIILFVMSFVYKMDHPYHAFILGMCGVFASLASAFFIAVFMRVFEICNQRKKQKNALKLLQPLFVEVYIAIGHFYPQIKTFATIKADDTIQYSKETIYYTNTLRQEGNRDFVNFDLEFSKAKYRVDKALDACLNSPLIFQCPDSVISLLTNLKLNGLTRSLLEVQTVEVDQLPVTAFMGIYKNYIEFDNYYTAISELSEREMVNSLRQLNDEEKEEYIRTIETILPQLPSHDGSIYKGSMRIQ